MTTAAFAKAIDFDRETRDFRLSLDGEFVGYAKSFYEGEETLDALAFNRLREARQAVRDDVEARADADAAAEDAEADAWLVRDTETPAQLAERTAHEAEQAASQERDAAPTWAIDVDGDYRVPPVAAADRLAAEAAIAEAAGARRGGPPAFVAALRSEVAL